MPEPIVNRANSSSTAPAAETGRGLSARQISDELRPYADGDKKGIWACVVFDPSQPAIDRVRTLPAPSEWDRIAALREVPQVHILVMQVASVEEPVGLQGYVKVVPAAVDGERAKRYIESENSRMMRQIGLTETELARIVQLVPFKGAVDSLIFKPSGEHRIDSRESVRIKEIKPFSDSSATG